MLRNSPAVRFFLIGKRQLSNIPKPVKPEYPQPEDCCGDGCAVCVYDLYEQQVQDYKLALEKYYHQHPNEPRGAGELDFATDGQPSNPADVAKDAFEEMEQRLRNIER